MKYEWPHNVDYFKGFLNIAKMESSIPHNAKVNVIIINNGMNHIIVSL